MNVYLGIGLGLAIVVFVVGTVWANKLSDDWTELSLLAVSVLAATGFTVMAWPASLLFALVFAPTVLRRIS